MFDILFSTINFHLVSSNLNEKFKYTKLQEILELSLLENAEFYLPCQSTENKYNRILVKKNNF